MIAAADGGPGGAAAASAASAAVAAAAAPAEAAAPAAASGQAGLVSRLAGIMPKETQMLQQKMTLDEPTCAETLRAVEGTEDATRAVAPTGAENEMPQKAKKPLPQQQGPQPQEPTLARGAEDVIRSKPGKRGPPTQGPADDPAFGRRAEAGRRRRRRCRRWQIPPPPSPPSTAKDSPDSPITPMRRRRARRSASAPTRSTSAIRSPFSCRSEL